MEDGNRLQRSGDTVLHCNNGNTNEEKEALLFTLHCRLRGAHFLAVTGRKTAYALYSQLRPCDTTAEAKTTKPHLLGGNAARILGGNVILIPI